MKLILNIIYLKNKKDNFENENHFFDFEEHLLYYRSKGINIFVKGFIKFKKHNNFNFIKK